MEKMMNKYLSILKIELKDLATDIELMVDEHHEKREDRKITEYVFLENLATLKNELLALDSFNSIMNGMNPGDYSEIDGFITEIKKQFKNRIEQCGLGEGIYTLIDKKLDKVLQYVNHD